jgi:hypothetical protein
VSDVTELSNIAQMGALVGDPVRALIVGALMDGTEHAAGELAVLAGATPQAASPHLALTATAVGGRSGHSESSDHIVAVDLSVPREMLRPRKTRNRDAGASFRHGLCGLFRRRDRLRWRSIETHRA